MKNHVPKVNTGDDVEFMCGTHAFAAVVELRDTCAACTRKTLAIVELLAEAHDRLRAHQGGNAIISKGERALMQKIDRALGKRATVAYPSEEP